jgi:hypothetical protein
MRMIVMGSKIERCPQAVRVAPGEFIYNMHQYAGDDKHRQWDNIRIMSTYVGLFELERVKIQYGGEVILDLDVGTLRNLVDIYFYADLAMECVINMNDILGDSFKLPCIHPLKIELSCVDHPYYSPPVVCVDESEPESTSPSPSTIFIQYPYIVDLQRGLTRLKFPNKIVRIVNPDGHKIRIEAEAEAGEHIVVVEKAHRVYPEVAYRNLTEISYIPPRLPRSRIIVVALCRLEIKEERVSLFCAKLF